MIISKTPFCKLLTQNVLNTIFKYFFKLPLGTNLFNRALSTVLMYFITNVVSYQWFLVCLVSLERWCRLRGNLLFYFKSRDQWSEPVGVLVLEQCSTRIDNPETTPPEGPFGFSIGKELS